MRAVRRIWILVLLAVGLVTSSTPAAEAFTLGCVAFTGPAVLTACGGLGYPTTGNSGTPVIPPPISIETAPYPHGLVVWGGESCGLALSSSACAGVEMTTKKPVPLGAGLCSLTGSGSVSGFCGLASGHVTIIIVHGVQTYAVDVYFSIVDGTIVITGLITKTTTGQTGKFSALGEATGPAETVTPGGGSCLASTATFFTLAGYGEGLML
jgi:hypothetical protein